MTGFVWDVGVAKRLPCPLRLLDISVLADQQHAGCTQVHLCRYFSADVELADELMAAFVRPSAVSKVSWHLIADQQGCCAGTSRQMWSWQMS